MSDSLVGTDWLAEHLAAPDLRVVDASWFMPAAGRDPAAEFAEARIPGAVRFDIDDVADAATDLPHMVPSAAKFASRMRKMGLGDGNRIVVYDANAFCASARVWWMFRLFGHTDVAVLDGGLTRWRAEGRPVESGPAGRTTERHFTARQNNVLLRDLDQLRANLVSRREQVVDARSAGRFAGTDPEPRPGLRSGHVPGSLNVPYSSVVTADGMLQPLDVLRRIFVDAGVDLSRPVVTTCGSGVTASVLALALHELGAADVAVYDGSWSEWGSRTDTPVAT